MGRSSWVYGPEPWTTIDGVAFSMWDLWLMVASVSEGNVGLDGLENLIRLRLRNMSWEDRDDAEAKLSQIDDLRTRVRRVAVPVGDLVATEMRDRKLVKEACAKVFEQSVSPKSSTLAMRRTPRARLDRRAKAGHWRKFPVSPAGYANILFEDVKAHEYWDARRAIRLARTLQSRWETLSKSVAGDTVEALALQRALLTVCHAAHDRSDDSYGRIAEVFTGAIRRYRALRWRETGIDPEVYVRDIVEFATWERCGQNVELAPLVGALPLHHGDLVVRVLEETISELRVHDLFRLQVGQAHALWAALLVGHERFEQFEALARDVGSAAWRPIVTLAEASTEAGRPDLALAVFAAANGEGPHRRFLHWECRRITGRPMPEARPVSRRLE